MELPTVTGLLAHLSLDWIIVAALVALGAFDGYASGAARAATAGFAVPIAVFLAALMPHAVFLSAIPGTIPHLAAIEIGAASVLAYVFVRRITETFGTGVSGILSAILGGVGFAAVIIAIWIGTEPLAALWDFGPSLQALFSESYRLYWVVGGLAALAFARG